MSAATGDRRRSRSALLEQFFEFHRQIRQVGGGREFLDEPAHALDIRLRKHVEEPLDIA